MGSQKIRNEMFRKIACIVGLIWIAIILCSPIAIQASSSLNVNITATGTSTGIPDAPTNFQAYQVASDEATLNWTIGTGGADYTVIYRSTSGYPSFLGSGYLAYNGTSNTTNDFGVSVDTTEYYYSAWSYSSVNGLYSIDYVTAKVGGNMTNAIMLIGILFVSLCLSGMGYYFKKVPIIIIACLLWLGVGAWSFTQVQSAYDIYFFIGCAGILMGILSALEPLLWNARAEKEKMLSPEEQDREIDNKHRKELDDSMGRIKRKRRPY